MLTFYRVNGFYNSDDTPFYSYLMCEQEYRKTGVAQSDFNDDDIFFYGLSRHEAEELIKEDQSSQDFTITAVFDA